MLTTKIYKILDVLHHFPWNRCKLFKTPFEIKTNSYKKNSEKNFSKKDKNTK